MWVKCARIILKNRLVLISILAILTAGMAYNASKVHLSYEYAALLPETDSSFINYTKFKQDFGSDANGLIIGLKTNDLYKLDRFNGLIDLCDSIRKFDGVLSTWSVAQAVQVKGNQIVPFFTEKLQTQAELDSIITEFENLPIYDGLLYSNDKEAFVLMVSIRQSILDSPEREDLIADIQSLVNQFSEAQGVETFITGMPFIRTQTSLKLQGELVFFIVLAVLICAVILYIIFKSVVNMLFSMLVVAVSVVWVLGWMGLFNFEISVLSAMLPPLIIVISVPNCVFFLNKYHQEYAMHGNKIKALQRVIYRVGNSLFLSNLTTAIGFSTFMVTDSRLLQEFGLLASLGILGVFVFSITLLTIVFSYLKPPSTQMLKHLESRMFSKVVDLLQRITMNHRPAVYCATIAFLCVAFVGMFKITSTGFVVDDLPADDHIMVDLRYAEEKFNGALPLDIQIEDTAKINLLRDKSLLRKIDRLYDSLETYPEISRPLSILDVMKFAWQSHNGGNPKYYVVPNTSDMFFQNKLKKIVKNNDGGFGGMQTAMVDSSGAKLRVSCEVKDIGTIKMADLEKRLQTDLDSIFPTDRYKTLITGTSIIYFKGTQYLLKNLFSSLALAILLIAFFMALLFRSKRMVLVSLIPNILPMFFTAALMGFFDIPIKASTILVFSIAFGISVDDTIHYLSRYRQGLKSSNWNIRESVAMAIQETSPSMISTSIILFFGFGIFAFSQFGGTEAMGVLVSFTLFFAMLLNNLLLPSLLLTLDKRITTQHFKEPLLDIYNEEEDIELEDLQIE